MDPASKFDSDPASNCTPDNSWPARRAIRNLGPIGVPAYARMGPSSVHRALEFPEHGEGAVGPSRALRSLEFLVADLVTLNGIRRHGYRRAWCSGRLPCRR